MIGFGQRSYRSMAVVMAMWSSPSFAGDNDRGRLCHRNTEDNAAGYSYVTLTEGLAITMDQPAGT